MTLSTSPTLEPVRDIQERFVDLICTDTDLMRAEFDAIVGAGWGGDKSPPQPGDVEGNAEPPNGPTNPDTSAACAPRQAASGTPCTSTFQRRPRPPPDGKTKAP